VTATVPKVGTERFVPQDCQASGYGIISPQIYSLLNEIRGAWRFRWAALSAAAIIAAAGWLIIFALPDRYRASAAVLVDTRTALKPALEGLTVEQDVTAQLNYVREALIAGPQLRRIAELTGLLPTSGVDPGGQEDVLSGLARRIQLSASEAEVGNPRAGSTYVISYKDTDRARALKVVGILLNGLVNETLGGKLQGVQNAQQFLETQIHDYEKRLRTAEDRLAAFKSSHLGQMPGERGGYFTELQKETEAVEDLQTQLLVAETRRNTLERQLHGNAAVSAATPAPVTGAGRSAAGVDTLSRIAETQAHLDQLLLQYTDKHPEVIATREALVELQQRRAAEIESLRHGDANAVVASGAGASPVYQSIQLALNQADVDVADIRTQLSRHQAKQQELRRFLNTAPQVEAEYAQLARDYDVNKAEYTALLSSYQKTRLGERADTAGSVRFEVVQPPSVSYRPVWPRRALLLGGVLLAAIAGGGALAYQLDRLWPLVSSAKGLVELTGVAVIGIVGEAFPTQYRRIFRRELWQFSLALTCLLTAFVIEWWLSRAGVRVNIPALNYMVNMWVS